MRHAAHGLHDSLFKKKKRKLDSFSFFLAVLGKMQSAYGQKKKKEFRIAARLLPRPSKPESTYKLRLGLSKGGGLAEGFLADLRTWACFSGADSASVTGEFAF